MMVDQTAFVNGLMQPSRDMIVRRKSRPKVSFGKVFGFVTTGFQHRRPSSRR